MPLTFTQRVVRHFSESNLTVHRLSTPFGNLQPPGPSAATPKSKLAVATLR